MLRFGIALFLAGMASAAVVDRIAIVIGRQVITELQIDEELRVTAFLNRQPIARDLNTRRAAASRLVEQLLIQQEMQVSRYPLPDAADVDKYLDDVRGSFGARAAFTEALSTYGLTEAVLKEHLALQLTTLRFIEFRFQPEIDISDAEIESAYERETSNRHAQHLDAPPTLAASRDAIRKTLADQRVDQALDAWLAQRRRRANVVYRDASLQ